MCVFKLVWMGQTLNMLLLVKCCSFSEKWDKKFTELLFVLLLTVFLTIFSGMTPQKKSVLNRVGHVGLVGHSRGSFSWVILVGETRGSFSWVKLVGHFRG